MVAPKADWRSWIAPSSFFPQDLNFPSASGWRSLADSAGRVFEGSAAVLQRLETVELERRKHPRIRILVDLEMAVGAHGIAHGVAENISREGVSLRLEEGSAPGLDKAVLLNFRIWTGRERLNRSLNGCVIRVDDREVALAFLDHDPVTEAAIQDLLYYVQLDHRHTQLNPHAA